MSTDNEIARSIGRLEGKMDQLISMVSTHFEDDKVSFKDVAIRIGRVEKRVWWATGAMGVVAFLIGKAGFTGFLGH